LFDYEHYVPILKAKQSECIALRNVELKYKKFMTPLFEIQPRETRKLLDRITKQIRQRWTDSYFLFLDVDREYLSHNLQEALQNYSTALDDGYGNGFSYVPVTGLNRPQEYQNLVSEKITENGQGVCIRLINDDWFDLEQTSTDIEDLLSFLRTNKRETDLILDFGAFLPNQAGAIATSVVNIINSINNVNGYRTLTFSGTAFPGRPSAIPKVTNMLPRSELQVWHSLTVNRNLTRIPSLGDYTTVHPVFPDVDFRFVTIQAKIKYATKSDWIYIRWEKGNSSNFVDVCQQLVRNPEFKGENFSWADKRIYDCAQHGGATGNAPYWVTLGINHHLTLLAQQCANHHVILI
jgi:hypothetical protein